MRRGLIGRLSLLVPRDATLKPRFLTVHLSDWELATVLAALRYWQQDLTRDEEGGPIRPDRFGKATTPLTVEEMDTLCDRISTR